MHIPRSTVVAFALLAASAGAWAQSSAPGSTTDPMGKGQSPRCDAMNGEQREQCLRDENAKTQGAPASSAGQTGGDSANGSPSASPSSEPSSSGSSSAAPSTDSSSSSSSSGASTPSSSDTSSGSLPATKSE